VKQRTSRKSLVRLADKAFGDFIKVRDNDTCVTCGASAAETVLDCGHLFSRVAYSTRWDERNAFAQCRGCNLRHEHDPGPLTIVFLKKYSDAAYDTLHRLHRITVKYHDADLQALATEYRNKLANLLLERGNGWDLPRVREQRKGRGSR
jgi:hypothetical protein